MKAWLLVTPEQFKAGWLANVGGAVTQRAFQVIYQTVGGNYVVRNPAACHCGAPMTKPTPDDPPDHDGLLMPQPCPYCGQLANVSIIRVGTSPGGKRVVFYECSTCAVNWNEVA